MIRHLLAIAPLALCVLPVHAATAAKTPPPEYAAYVAAARKADAITDPLQRCLAYPDLPGNTWEPGAAKARCAMFLTPVAYTLEAIDKELVLPGGAAKLDDHFRALLDAHFNDPPRREQVTHALSVFYDEDLDKAERIARAWVGVSKDSAFAHAALGRVLAKRGWNARGTKLVKDTPPANFRKMEAYFEQAAVEYAKALEVEPKLFPACIGLMAIGRQSSDTLQASATARCLEADPASFHVVDELMTAAEPRWGGSEAAMRSVAAYAMARKQQNPVLTVFAFHHALYAIERMDDSDAQAIAVLEPAASQVPNAGYLRAVGGAYLRKGEDWKAFVHLSQALRFSPEYADERRFRGIALEALGETRWARADAEQAVALDPKNGSALRLLGRLVRELDGPVAALPHFRRAMDDAKHREWAFNDTCGALIDAKRSSEATQCVDDLLAEYPANPEGWRQRLILIAFDAPGSMEAMEKFVALHDPKRWRYHADVADRVRKIIAAKKGTASPADLFEARVARGLALEHTETGRAYMTRSAPVFSRQLGETLGACKPGGARDATRFTAVLDLQANGTPANILMQPVDALTSCIAKHMQAHWKLPSPPDGYASGYPMTVDVSVRSKPSIRSSP